jgi:CheY-like chemotaxis protein
VAQASDARAMDAILDAKPIDLVILDLMLPGEDGLSICRRLAQAPALAIIMVSAAGEEVDRVLGLEFGADDYLAKPFGPRELLARTRAVLRRRSEGVRTLGRGSLYRFEGFSYDPARRELRAPSGYYVSMDESAGGGELELADPRGALPALYAPQLSFGLPGCLSAGGSDFIAPSPGVLLLFPAWLQHAVRPHASDQPQISVAFNLCV